MAQLPKKREVDTGLEKLVGRETAEDLRQAGDVVGVPVARRREPEPMSLGDSSFDMLKNPGRILSGSSIDESEAVARQVHQDRLPLPDIEQMQLEHELGALPQSLAKVQHFAKD